MTAAVPDLPPRRPTVVTRDAARRIHWLGGTQTVYDTGGTTGAFSLSADHVPPGGGPVWHRHSRETEVFVVRGGACEFFAPTADGPARVEPGGMIALPPGVPHRFVNVADDSAPVLTLMAPGGNGQFFVDLSAPADSPDDPTNPPDPEAFARVGRRYGITMFGPDDAVGSRMPSEVLPLAGGAKPIVRQAGEGERLKIGDAALTLKFAAEDTGDRLTLAEAALPPGASLPAVRHASCDAALFNHGGAPLALTWWGDGGPSEEVVPPDAYAAVPWGTAYRVHNAGPEPARCLMLWGPAGVEQFWRAAAAGDVAAAGRDWGVEVNPAP